MFVFRLIYILLAVAGACEPAFARDIERIALPRYWQGGAIADDLTGQFTHCAGTTSYSEATSLSVRQDRYGNWLILIVRPEWNNTELGETDLRYRFNRGGWQDGTINVVHPQALLISTKEQSQFIGNFKSKNTFEFEVYGARHELALTGTSKLIDALRKCVVDHTPEDFRPDSVMAQDAVAFGTGLIVNKYNKVLTNYHVVKECDALHIIRKDHAPVRAKLLAEDEENDLALIETNASFYQDEVGVFRMGGELKFGEQIFVFGFPLAGALSASGNFVLGNITALSGLADDERYVQISAPVQPGNSGGPLLDRFGLIVGLVSMRIDELAVMRATGAMPQNVNFALTRKPVFTFLARNGVDYLFSAPGEELEPTEIAEKAVANSVEIACNITDPLKALARLP